MKAVWRFYSFRMLIGALFFDGIALGKVPLTNTALVLGVMLVLFVVGAPEGIIGLIGRARRNRNEGEG